MFIGGFMMGFATCCAMFYGAFVLWRKGKLTMISSLPKPPTPPT